MNGLFSWWLCYSYDTPRLLADSVLRSTHVEYLHTPFTLPPPRHPPLDSFGLSAVCTHLGCVVPWNKAENKFMCPCHGSQYNDEGKVVRGPAPLSLALAHLDDADGKISLRTWTEEDFRTGLKPWWS